MRINKIYWKFNNSDNAIKALIALQDNYLVIQIASRQGKRQLIHDTFDAGMQYTLKVGVIKQIAFVGHYNNKVKGQYYIIKSI